MNGSRTGVSLPNRRGRRGRDILIGALALLLFACGAFMCLCPLWSYSCGVAETAAAREGYAAAVGAVSAPEAAELWAEAEGVNARLYNADTLCTLPEDVMRDYQAAINPAGDGMIGTVEIPSIEVSLPFYHTMTQKVLSRGAGHLEWTSLPTGEPTTHTVIGAHNGYRGQALFQRLPEVSVGETFSLRVLDRQFIYAVDRAGVVDSHDIATLFPVPGACLCTLMTCGEDDSQRFLVRGQLCAVEPLEGGEPLF